jgi:UDPglucose 6-dehydrogenase
MKISMIGCGKLGLPCAEVMAEHYDLIGYDIVKDPSATILLTDTIEEAIKDRDLIFIAVPTPHSKEYDGRFPITDLPPKDFDYTIVQDILSQINPLVNRKQLVVLISTVLPGTVRKHLAPLITNARFIYNPYLIAMGSVKWDMVNPECLIIGTRDGDETTDAKLLVDFYKPIMKNDPKINIGTWDEAESIKIFYNTWISTKIGLVNMIQDVAEKNGNINVDIVTDALKAATQRITGPKYMTAGMGDAGACTLPNFTVTVNDTIMTMENLYNLYNTNDTFAVNSVTHKCDQNETKLIKKVTRTPFNGKMIKIDTALGEIIVTGNHLLPVNRNGNLLLVRADSMLITDKLYLSRG